MATAVRRFIGPGGTEDFHRADLTSSPCFDDVARAGVPKGRQGALVSPHPPDWPTDGPIDLARHDLPHASSTTEWWYVNSHLTAADGRPLSLFAAFFRIATGKD